jgi:hypothetical protein
VNRPLVIFLGVVIATALCASEAFSQTPPPPATVTDAIFRSRWEGLQADQINTKSAEAMAGLRPGDPGYSYAEGFANSLLSGLKIGPLDIHPGLSLGWEYSTGGNSGTTQANSADSSFFIAPTIGLNYEREIGPWSVSAAYGAGFRYYLNPNYTSAGTNNQRNPFTQSGQISVSHIGDRHKLTFRGTGYSGTGYDAVTGTNVVQTNLAAAMDYSYTLATYVDIGANGSYTLSNNQGAQSGSGNGNLGSYSAGAWTEWFATGKTRWRLELDTGQSSQTLQNAQRSNINYVQTLVSVDYTMTEKLRMKLGLGAAYLTAPQTTNSQYTGLRPRYTIEADYDPTEKTSLKASFGLLGTALQPDFRVEATWQPRVNTGFSIAVYQSQNFSLTTVNQVQITRGVIGSVSQRFFSKVVLELSGGYEQIDNLSLSNGVQAGNQQPFGFASANLTWNFSNWSYWQISLWRSGQSTTNNGGSSNNTPESRATVSFNLTF